MVDSTNRLGGARATFGSKKPVTAASTGDIPTLSGFQTIDGISFSSTSANLRVLVKDQAAPEQNGIYEQASSSWTRAKDFDGNTDFVKGTPVWVAGGGAVNGGKCFQVSSSDPPNVGVDPITFVNSLFEGEDIAEVAVSVSETLVAERIVISSGDTEIKNSIASYALDLDDLAGVGAGWDVRRVATGATNTPSGANVNGSHVLTMEWDNATARQTYFEHNSQSVYTRARNSSAWGPWSPLGIPPGAMMTWPFATAPLGWLECDGSQVTSANPYLRAKLVAESSPYGTAGGNPLLPDLRGEFVRGWDHGAGVDPDAASRTDRGDGTDGDNIGTKQADEFDEHGHPARYTTSGGETVQGSGGIALRTGGSNFAAYTGTLGDTAGEQISGSGGNETRPRNVNVMWIIKT